VQSETVVSDGTVTRIVQYDATGTVLPSIFDQLRLLQDKILAKAVAKARLAVPSKRRRKRSPEDAASSLEFIHRMLRTRTAPAREWLSESTQDLPRTLGEMDASMSATLVDSLLELGAEEVLAVEIEGVDGESQTTNHLVVRLPSDPAARARVMAFEREHAKAEGFESEGDWGQDHVYMKLC